MKQWQDWLLMGTVFAFGFFAGKNYAEKIPEADEWKTLNNLNVVGPASSTSPNWTRSKQSVDEKVKIEGVCTYDRDGSWICGDLDSPPTAIQGQGVALDGKLHNNLIGVPDSWVCSQGGPIMQPNEK